MPTITTCHAPLMACQPCVNQSSEAVSRSTLPSRFGVVLVGQGKADGRGGIQGEFVGGSAGNAITMKARADASEVTRAIHDPRPSGPPAAVQKPFPRFLSTAPAGTLLGMGLAG